jgi:hypothetical protein
MMLDDHDRIAGVDQSIEYLEQLVDILQVQPRGRFVKEVNCTSGSFLAQFACQFDPLGLPPDKVTADCPSRI